MVNYVEEFLELSLMIFSTAIVMTLVIVILFIIFSKKKKVEDCHHFFTSDEIKDLKIQMKKEEEEGLVSDELIEKLKNALENKENCL